MAVSWCLSTRQIWPNNFNEIQNMFIFISRFNNVCKKKSCGNINQFPKKIQFYNCQIYGIVLLTPKAKTNPLGKVKTDRRKYLERAEISETASLIYIWHSLFSIKFSSALWGNYLQNSNTIISSMHFFFFVIPWFRITSLELTFK